MIMIITMIAIMITVARNLQKAMKVITAVVRKPKGLEE